MPDCDGAAQPSSSYSFAGIKKALTIESALQWRERHYPGSTVRGTFHRNNRRAWKMVNRFGFVAVSDSEEFIRLGLAPEDHVVVECTTRSIFGARKSA